MDALSIENTRIGFVRFLFSKENLSSPNPTFSMVIAAVKIVAIAAVKIAALKTFSWDL